MTKKSWISIPVLALAFLMAACGSDETAEPQSGLPSMEAGAVDEGVLALIMEIQQIEQMLQPLQMQALEDEALAIQLTSIQGQIESALRDADPVLLARADELEAELIAAQEAGDHERFQTMIIEAQVVHDSLQSLRSEILERPEIREPIDAFEAAHRARMIELDPEAGRLLDRVEEIMAELDNHFGDGQ